MFAVNVWLAASAALWAGACGEEIMENALTFLYEVVQEDEYWMKYLDVKVKVDPTVVPFAARGVLQDLNLIPHDPIAHRQAPEPQPTPVDTSRPSTSSAASTSPAEGADGASAGDAPPAVVSARALRFIVNVVTNHNKESDAIEFGMTVMTSAIKCNVLPYLLLQLKVVEKMTGKDDLENFYRPKVIWKNLVLYMDKIARLKDSLDTAADLYHKWGIVVKQTLEPSLDSPTGAIGDVNPFKELLQATLNELCLESTIDEIEARMNFNPAVESWNTPLGARAIFQKCQDALEKLFKDLPFTTMDLTLWSDYLNNPEILEKPTNTFILV